MEPTTWTLIALLGASVFGSFGAFFYLGARIDTRIDALGARLDARIDVQAGVIRSLRTELSAHLDTLSGGWTNTSGVTPGSYASPAPRGGQGAFERPREL